MSKFTKIDSQFLIDNISLFTNKKTVIITGAGISVSCGIPDFRSSNGIFKTIREKLKIKGQDLFNYRYSRDKETRSTYFKFIAHLKEIVDKSEPSITHDFLSSIKKYQKKVRIYSQNIDMLEEKTGCVYNDKNSSELVYLHGNLKHLICIYCGYKIEYTEKENKILKNGEDLQCKRCVEENIKKEKSGRRSSFEGYMHTNIIHYDQPHHDAFRIGKLFEKDMDVDFFIVMGTSLKVYGVKDLVKRGLRSCLNNNGKSIFVNLEEPGKEYKGLFDYFWNDDCDDFCKAFNKGIEMAELNDKIEKIKIKKEKKKDFTDEMPIDKLEKTRSKKENKKDLINKIEKISFEKDSIDEMSIDKLEKIVIKKEKKKDLYDNIEKIIRKKENKKDAFDKIEKISLKKESIDELKKIGTKKEMKKNFIIDNFDSNISSIKTSLKEDINKKENFRDFKNIVIENTYEKEKIEKTFRDKSKEINTLKVSRSKLEILEMNNSSKMSIENCIKNKKTSQNDNLKICKGEIKIKEIETSENKYKLYPEKCTKNDFNDKTDSIKIVSVENKKTTLKHDYKVICDKIDTSINGKIVKKDEDSKKDISKISSEKSFIEIEDKKSKETNKSKNGAKGKLFDLFDKKINDLKNAIEEQKKNNSENINNSFEISENDIKTVKLVPRKKDKKRKGKTSLREFIDVVGNNKQK